MAVSPIRKDYPTTGVLKLLRKVSNPDGGVTNQEGLPDYWGIETVKNMRLQPELLRDQEGLPDYWGIETFTQGQQPRWRCHQSGRITRLLGY